jgi:hypothetical protein
LCCGGAIYCWAGFAQANQQTFLANKFPSLLLLQSVFSASGLSGRPSSSFLQLLFLLLLLQSVQSGLSGQPSSSFLPKKFLLLLLQSVVSRPSELLFLLLLQSVQSGLSGRLSSSFSLCHQG